MKQFFYVLLISPLLFAGCGGSDDSTPTSTDTTVDSAAEVADVVAVSAGGVSQAGGNSAPDASASSLSVRGDQGFVLAGAKRVITGFTYDSATGGWTGTAQNGATPTLKFYRKDTGAQITADPTEVASYQPGGDLFGLTPLDQTSSQIQMEVTVVVSKTFMGGYTVSMTAISEKVDGEPANIGANATYTYTADSGTIIGDFGTITMSNIGFTAADQGAEVDGRYDFTIVIGEDTFSGSAEFDEAGCKGATVTNGSGTTLGTAVLTDGGTLVFTDAVTGETTTLTRLES